MSIIPALLAAFCGLVAGVLVGVVFGFSMASHTDVLRGVRPNTKNRLVLFLARPTSELGLAEGVLLVGIMCLWIGIFFGLCALPAFAAERLSGDGPPLVLVAYGGFALAAGFGKRFGAHAWSVIS